MWIMLPSDLVRATGLLATPFCQQIKRENRRILSDLTYVHLSFTQWPTKGASMTWTSQQTACWMVASSNAQSWRRSIMYTLELTKALNWKMWFMCNKALTKKKQPKTQHNVKRKKNICTAHTPESHLSFLEPDLLQTVLLWQSGMKNRYRNSAVLAHMVAAACDFGAI